MFVKIVAIYAAAGYVTMIVLYFAFWCRPFHNYWSVPAMNRKRSFSTVRLATDPRNQKYQVSGYPLTCRLVSAMFYLSPPSHPESRPQRVLGSLHCAHTSSCSRSDEATYSQQGRPGWPLLPWIFRHSQRSIKQVLLLYPTLW